MLNPRLGTLALGLAAACDGGSANPESDSATAVAVETAAPPATLLDLEAIAQPDASPKTSWLGMTEGIKYADGALFADQASGEVVRLTTRGTHLQTFGERKGGGPGELRNVDAFDVGGGVVTVLDRANLKVIVFDDSAGVEAEFRVSSDYLSVVNVDSDLVGLIPGVDSSAVDLYRRSGERVGGIGESSALPMRCAIVDDCAPSTLRCSGCSAASLQDGSVAVLNGEEGILVVFNGDGQVRSRLDFLEDDPLVKEWAAADAPLTAQAQAQADARAQEGERVEVLKSYFTSIDAVGDQLILSVVPAAKDFRERGYEAWIIDPASGDYERFGYPRRGPGFYATTDGDGAVYAVEPRTGGIFAASIPGRP